MADDKIPGICKNHPTRLQDLPDLLKLIRTSRKITTRKMAELLEMKQPNFVRYERGNYQKMPMWRVLRMLEIFNIQLVVAVIRKPKKPL